MYISIHTQKNNRLQLQINITFVCITSIPINDVFTIIHRKLTPYFFVTCGECTDATDSSNGTSFADRFSAAVTVLSEQNSVANRKAANVSDCKYSSCSFDSMYAIHWYADKPVDHIAFTVSSIVATS